MLLARLRPEYLLRPRQIVRRIARQVVQTPTQATVRLPWGVDLAIRPNESAGVSPGVWRSGVYDLAVSEALWRLTEPGCLAIDVGANIGYTAGILAVRAGAGGRVLAFEPNPETAGLLRLNVDLISRTGETAAVDVRQVALAAITAEGFLYTGPETVSNSGVAHLTGLSEDATAVQVTTLDAMLEAGDQVGLLKIDVEGGELDVLRGAEGALAQGRIAVIIYESFASARAEIEAWLEPYGFKVFGLGRSFRGPSLAKHRQEATRFAFEPPSYVAALNPERVEASMAARGWHCLAARR